MRNPADKITSLSFGLRTIVSCEQDRQPQFKRLFLGQPVQYKIRDSLRRRRVEVGEHCHHIAGPRTNLQITIHAGSAAAMPKAANPANHLVAETIGILSASRG